MKNGMGCHRKRRMIAVCLCGVPSDIYAVKIMKNGMGCHRKRRMIAAFEAFFLENKANGKELDPPYFDETEKFAFQTKRGGFYGSRIEL